MKNTFLTEESICSASMMPAIGAKPSGRSLSKARNSATFVISKPTSIPSYPMRNTRPIYPTTLYLPNPISTAVPNLRSDRRKPYAFQRQRSAIGHRAFSLFWGVSPNGKCASIFHNRRALFCLKGIGGRCHQQAKCKKYNICPACTEPFRPISPTLVPLSTLQHFGNQSPMRTESSHLCTALFPRNGGNSFFKATAAFFIQ